MNEEFNFDPNQIERFRQRLEKQHQKAEKNYKEIQNSPFSIGVIGCSRLGKSTILNSLFSKQSFSIAPDLPGFNDRVDNVNDDNGLKNLWNTYSQVKNLLRETQNIDKDINAFLESTKDFLKTSCIIIFDGLDDSQTNYNNDPSYLEVSISLILEIQERNQKLLSQLTKLEATLQAVILMLLVTNAKQIPSFTVYLICNLNMNVVEWLSSGFGEEMMGDLSERHHEIKDEHPNSDILVSFILLATALQMLWSFLLIKLDDSMSNEEIKSYFVGMPSSLAYS